MAGDLPDTVHADPAVAVPSWRPARRGDTPGQLAPELHGVLPEGQQPNEPINNKLISQFDNAQTLARVVHARAGLTGWDLVVASTRDALEAVAPILVSSEVARVRADTLRWAADRFEERHPGRITKSIVALFASSLRIWATEAERTPAPAESVVGAPPDARHPEDDCHRCGRSLEIPWTAPSPLWNAVMRGGSILNDDDFDGIVCPTCFAQLAKDRGIADLWRFHAERVLVPLETVTPSGRVWDPDAWLWRDPVGAVPEDEGTRQEGLINVEE